jgi:hypothetical protein
VALENSPAIPEMQLPCGSPILIEGIDSRNEDVFTQNLFIAALFLIAKR